MLRHPPCSGAAGALWPPGSLESSPSVVLSGDKRVSVPWPGQKKWLQVKNLNAIASPEPASSVTSWDLGVVAGKGGKGKGERCRLQVW